MSKPEEIHGDYTRSGEDAIEAASSAALIFLKDASMIFVDDADLSELRACQQKLLAAESWAMIFESHASELNDKLSNLTKNVEQEKNKENDSNDNLSRKKKKKDSNDNLSH